LNLAVIVTATGPATGARPSLPPITAPVTGRPALRFVVDAARALEPDVLIVVGDNEEQRLAAGPNAKFLISTRPGTLPGLLAAMDGATGRSGAVLVLPGNMPLLRHATLREMVARHRTEKAVMTHLAPAATPPEAPANRSGQDRAPGNVLCFRADWLWPNLVNLVHLPRREGDEAEPYDLAAVALEQGETVTSLAVDDPLDILVIDDYQKLARAEAEMRRRINVRWLLSGVTLIHPEATYIEADVEIGPGTVIWPNTILQGQTRIGQECTIGPGSVIRDSTIGDGCRVELSVIEQAIMEEGSNVGPFGHLRRGAHLGPGVHMGNFGEVKNSYLGPGAKMGHFSYLGDASVGAEANIGAGTITCNYDGQRKHRTVIGQEAFIGSGTMLVAPVEVGDGAKTGAGSVVTHDVPPDSVAYGVPARIQHPPISEEAEVE